MTTFNVETFNIELYDSILLRGLSNGKGDPNGQMCIEAAICNVLGLPHDDDPKCVAQSVRSFKISLNDKKWSSPEARAKGLRDLGLAQLGSLDIVSDADFTTILAKKIIQILIPKLYRQVFPDNQKLLDLVDICEKEGTKQSVNNASNAAYAAYSASNAAYSADYATDAANYASNAAHSADYASNAAHDEYLILVANLALEVLKELNSPGCKLLCI